MRWLYGVALLVLGLAIWFEGGRAFGSARPEAAQSGIPPDGSAIKILSYNVKGTPWPPLADRTPELEAIAAGLRAQRQRGGQPQVVVLQEAFLDEAKAIGRAAGYRYQAFGPGVDDANAVPPGSAADRGYAAGASFWSGETIGKHLDSGLALFSDYPIDWVRSVAFPDFACAGFDCLANKGALAVALHVPGLATPVIVVTTHLNSNESAGVPASRSDYAFGRQVDVLGDFVAKLETLGNPLLLAGDFNVGSDPGRTGRFNRLIADRHVSVVAAEHDCGLGCRRLVTAAQEQGARLAAGKSMILYRGDGPLLPSLFSTFGREPNGSMLSDHIGLAVRFAITPPRGRKGAAVPARA